jgi:hypothetical protein
MPAAPSVSQGPEIAGPPTPDLSSTPLPGKSSGEPAGSSSDDELMSDSFGDLETISKPKPAPALKPATKPDEAKTPKPEVEQEKPAEQQKTAEAKSDKQPSKPATLRAAYENVKRRNQELEQKVKEFQQVKPSEDPRLKTYQERLEAAEKRREELENEIRYSAYEKSPEYQDQFQRPFEEAYQWARQSVARLKVLQEDGPAIQATPDDFDKILLIPDDGEAIDVAEKMFGNKAKIVLDHRWEMKKLDAARYRAIENFRKQGGERQQKMTEAQAREREQIGKMWGELNTEAAERFPKWFKPEDGDEDGNKLLEEGYRLADAAFSNGNGMPPEQLVRLHASIRNRAAAFTREVYRNNKLSERVAELENQLKEYQASEPGPGSGGGGSKVTGDEFEELVADA